MAPTETDMEERTRAAKIAMLVPESTRENYRALILDTAQQQRITVEEARQRLLDGWRTEAETNPVAGTDVLADWLDTVSADDLVADELDPSAAARVRGMLNVKAEGLSRYPVDLTDDEKDEIVRYRDAVNGQLPEQIEAANNVRAGIGAADLPDAHPDSDASKSTAKSAKK